MIYSVAMIYQYHHAVKGRRQKLHVVLCCVNVMIPVAVAYDGVYCLRHFDISQNSENYCHRYTHRKKVGR